MLIATGIAVVGLAAPGIATAETIVTLTFDDGTSDQYQVGAMLRARGMHATFFVNSASVGASSNNMTWAELRDLAADGNEIGSHTVNHVRLTDLDTSEVMRQVCNDRAAITSQGLRVTSFAYPFTATNETVKSIVQTCGFNSARGGQIARFGETIPPADLYDTRTAESDTSGSAKLAGYVEDAERNGGGWVQLLLHRVCATAGSCGSSGITTADLTEFLDWLQPRAANGTVVKTVDDVIGGTVRPIVTGPPPESPSGPNMLWNPSLEQDANDDGVSDCWERTGFGTNTSSWSRTTDSHSGTFAEKVEISNYTSGDQKLMTRLDLGSCAPSVNPGQGYTLGAWYKSSAPVYFTVFTRNSAGGWSWWRNGALLPPSVGWTQAVFVTPAIPDGATGLSFGLALGATGFLTVDDLSMEVDASPPTVEVTSPTEGATVRGSSVVLSANASDDQGVSLVRFLVNGVVVGTDSTAPYSVTWNSAAVDNGSVAITAQAVDLSSNTTLSATRTAIIGNSTNNLLQNPSLEEGSAAPVCWGRAGFGENTFTWTRTSDAHSGGLAERLDVSSFGSGQRVLVSAQDSGACAPVASPGQTFAVRAWYKSSAPSILVAYYRNAAGWQFWTQSPLFPASSDWSRASWITPRLPDGATAISIAMGLRSIGSLTMDDFSLIDPDEPPAADTTPPAVALSAPAEGEAVSGVVTLVAAASDDVAIDRVDFLVDGAVVGSSTAAPYSVGWDSSAVSDGSHVIEARALDAAGNSAVSASVTIDVRNVPDPPADTTPPTSTIACGGSTCLPTWYREPVMISLSATDDVGVAQIRYTTDGSVPTATYGSLYTAPVSVATTTTITFRAFDGAGNAEPAQSQLVLVDTVAPTVAITSPASGATIKGNVKIVAAATDAGSGVARITFYVDGQLLGAVTSTPYQIPWNTKKYAKGSHTLTAVAEDMAGNTTASSSVVVVVAT